MLGFSGEQELKVLKSYFIEEKIMLTSSDLIQKQDDSPDVHEDHCDALSTAVDNFSIGDLAAKDLSYIPASVEEVWQRDLKPTSNDDKISYTKYDDYSSKQIGEKSEEFNDELEASPERVPLGHLRKKLLILDINGLLADIQCRTPKGYKADKTIARRAGEDRLLNFNLLIRLRLFFFTFKSICATQIVIGSLLSFSVFKRPFCSEFLKFCFWRFDVAIWSSRTK